MTTLQDLQDQMKREINEFRDKIYDGNIPKSIMEMFKKAMMVVPPSKHRFEMSAVKKMINKRHDELSYAEVGAIVNLVYDTPFQGVYDSLEEGVETTLQLEKLQAEYSKVSVEFERKMKAKYERLVQLSGIKNAVPMIPIAQA